MRNFIFAIATVGAAFTLLHCSSGSSGSGPSHSEDDDAGAVTERHDSGPSSKPPSSPPPDAGPKTVTDAGHDAAPPPRPKANDAGPANTGPGATCTALSSCCSKLTNSLEQIGCLLASGKKNELVCAGAMLTFKCSSAGSPSNPNHGPSCSGLTSGALYCGNDGPNGDANTLYECNGSNISIVRQCTNGCKINDGVDDACASSGTGGGTTGANCSGFSGRYCGNDGVGGSANTLYLCSNDTVASSTPCSSGCVTNSDPTVDDYCATDNGGGGGGGSGVSCSGLPDYNYCGSDGVNGDPDTLYTCSGGTMTGSQPCSNGCTVGSSNSDDYCSFTSGGGGGGPDCSGLSDGTYCGSNGVMGDPDTVYTCSNGYVYDAQFCDYGCYAGYYGGSDSCN